MQKLKYVLLCFLLSSYSFIAAQNILSLDSCRSLALQNNKELKISQKEVHIAAWQHKAALTNYYPKIFALASYMQLGKELSLLSDGQKKDVKQLGAHTKEQFQEIGQIMAQKYPHLAPVMQDFTGLVSSRLGSSLEQVKGLIENLRIDTRSLSVGSVNLMQPIYIGGKIRAYDRITDYAEKIAKSKNKLSTQEVLLQTDQTYWLVISLSNKKKLADSYVKLLQKMEDDVEKMIVQGVATKADGLTVKVKVNEAEMQQTKAHNGLSLAKMSLCQICGLDLDTPIILSDEEQKNLNINIEKTAMNKEIAMQNRPEIQSLTLAGLAKREKIKIERSEFLPQLTFTGNYLLANPTIFNGLEDKFKGMWSFGLQLKIPIWHWQEGKYKINMARAEADIIDYKIEEAKEKITLQVSQANFKITEAIKQLAMTTKNIEKAEENLRYAQLGFKEGVIPPSRVLEAHTAWYDAQSEKIDAQIAVKLSQVALEKALGTLAVEK